MPAKSRAQVGFIMTHPQDFGGRKNALDEWVKPTKGKDLPKHVPKKGKDKKPRGK